jgi:hypothetical protein
MAEFSFTLFVFFSTVPRSVIIAGYALKFGAQKLFERIRKTANEIITKQQLFKYFFMDN